MASTPPIRRRTLVTSALGMAALTACTSTPGTSADGSGSGPAASDGGGAGGDTPAEESSPPPDPSTAFTTVSLFWGRSEVTVGVRPLVRTGEHLVLTLDLSTEDPHGDVGDDLITNFDFVWGGASGDWRGIRLLDLDGDIIAPPAVDDEFRSIWNGTDTSRYDDAELEGSIQLVFGDLGLDTVSLYLPKIPLVTGLPVVDGDPPEISPDEEDPLDLAAVEAAPLLPMQALSVDLLEPIHEQADAESVTVSIGSDVLFDSSSAELSEQAQDVLDDAAARIARHEPGPVTVIGHTDDVDDEAFNLDLSRRRAEAVAKTLGTRIDTEAYPLTTEGRGESAPIADNSTEEGRARNRRVELEITAPLRETQEPAEAAEPPPFDGPVSTGEEGVRFDEFVHVPRPVRLRALGARFVSEHLVVTLEAVCEDDEVDSLYGLEGFAELPGYWDTIRWGRTNGGIAVVTGSTMTGPIFHDSGTDEEDLEPLTDLYTPSRIDGVVPRILELVYPRTITGLAPGGTVTLQYGDSGSYLDDRFRFTDIPIAD